MSDSTTLSIRLSNKTKDQLADLALRTHRTRSFLAAEAIASYVEREAAIVQAIEDGLADLRAGRLVSHDEVVRRARAMTAAAITKA